MNETSGIRVWDIGGTEKSFIIVNGCGSVEVTANATRLQDFRHCTIIEGHLRIQLTGDNNETWDDLSLPELTQVTDYVLIYRVSHLSTLDTILPRLAVIRGNVLFHEHALVVFGNIHLRELGLSNLTAILKGSVRIEKNWSLCPGTSDRWKGVTSDQVTNIVQDNYEMCIYDPCEGTGNCTLYTSAIYTNCLNVGGCREGEQCHPECVGGCRLPGNATACVACKHYQHGSACVRTCPAQSPRNVHDLRYKCVTASTCEAMSGIVRMMELPESDISAPVCIHCDGMLPLIRRKCYSQVHLKNLIFSPAMTQRVCFRGPAHSKYWISGLKLS
nr:insulin receptor-related protein-like [Penaeus vannamei]